MAQYYISLNPQPTGDHEVHNYFCYRIPKHTEREYLGEFDNCLEAVKHAARDYHKVDGCFYCSTHCHRD